MKVFRVKRRGKPARRLAAESQTDTRPVILAVDDAEDLLALIGKALACTLMLTAARARQSTVPLKRLLESLMREPLVRVPGTAVFLITHPDSMPPALVPAGRGPLLVRWSERLFTAMSRNAGSAADYLNLPANRVIELGTKLQR